MGIYFSPAVGVRLKSWSFADGKILDGPSWKDERPTYYIFHSHGISPTPWQFWIEFQVRICGGGGIRRSSILYTVLS